MSQVLVWVEHASAMDPALGASLIENKYALLKSGMPPVKFECAKRQASVRGADVSAQTLAEAGFEPSGEQLTLQA